VRSKYAWKQAYFSDGSVIKDKDLGQMVGAAVWRASDEQAFLIQPNGHGPTNTINRAEAAAVYHILNDICPPTEEALIFTDSQVTIQRLQKMIHHPETMLTGAVDIHSELTRRTAELILSRAESGIHTRILKVKSHTGIMGNEMADQAAKQAAQAPDKATLVTPAHNPFAGKTWLVHQAAGTCMDPQHRAVSNLGRGLKQAVRAATKLGFSRRTTYVQAWEDTYADPEGAHPQSSNAFWTKAPHGTRRLVLKARSGTLYNQKLALLYKRATTDCCPLCGQPDSVGHILGGCRHRTMKGHYISRHDKAVRMIHKALQKSSQGGFYSIVDAGPMADLLNDAANGKRIPEWVLPDIDPLTRKKMRPDILRIKGLRVNATPEEVQAAHERKGELVMQIIEVGYAPDTRWRDTLAKKQAQHSQLKAALEMAGWTVEEHVVILGRAGTCYNHTLNTLQQLGMHKEAAVTLMTSLHMHSATKLREIVLARRKLENSHPRPNTRKGVG
jgi:ribonuclease HI